MKIGIKMTILMNMILILSFIFMVDVYLYHNIDNKELHLEKHENKFLQETDNYNVILDETQNRIKFRDILSMYMDDSNDRLTEKIKLKRRNAFTEEEIERVLYSLKAHEDAL
jgi:hypothetical protein